MFGHVPRRRTPGIDREAHWTKLELEDRLVAIPPYKALQQRDVQAPIGLEFPATDLPDVAWLQVQEQRELGSPLVEQRRPMDEHQC